MIRPAPSLAALAMTAALSAHGGQFRGPGQAVPPGAIPLPVVPVPTGRPIPAGVPTPAPTTGARDLVAFARTWQPWWEFNKEPYLVPRVRGETASVTGSDDFYLGVRGPRRAVDVLLPTDKDRAERIVPALAALLAAERNRDVQSACLVALAKVGLDAPDSGLEDLLAQRIARDDQEVRETAVLALGIGGRSEAYPLLASLVQNDAQGRRLAERAEVRDRTRAFAAYGLGLLARRVGDPQLSQQVHDLLWPLVEDRRIDDRDLQTAAITGLGALRADPTRSADKRLAWQTVEELMGWFEQDLGAGDEFVQAHAPIAIARLLGRGTSPLHRRCKERFAAELDEQKRRGAPLRQSCAIALGMLAVPAEEHAPDAAFGEVLREQWSRGPDRVTRNFAAMSLGRIGGAANREWLLKAYQRASRADEAPWLALALGVLAEPTGAAGKPDAALAELLLDDLEDASTDDQRAALGVALGLTAYPAAAATMLRVLQANEGDQYVAGYLCIGLGLLRDPAAVPTLQAILERSSRRPFLLQQCAVALGCLGDREANDRLVAMLRSSDSVAVLAAVASAIGRIGDRRAIDALVQLTADRDMTKLGRAFVAAALGGVGDKDLLPWNVPLSVDVNYATDIDTLTNGSTGVLDIL